MIWLKRIPKVMDSRAAWRVAQIVAFLSLFLSLAVGARQYSLAGCLAEYNNQAAQATGQRSDAAEEDRQALDEMLTTIANAKERGAAAAALRTYVDTRARADAKRAKNPPPAPPSVSCQP